MANKKTHLVLTYNNVEKYPAGVYQGKKNKVIVHSQDKRYYNESPKKLSELLHSIYGQVNMEKIDNAVVYAGLNALEGALNVASGLVHDGKSVKVVACSCQGEQKRRFSRDRNVEINWCECGGEDTLGEMVKSLLRE